MEIDIKIPDINIGRAAVMPPFLFGSPFIKNNYA
jgi:hypothetical protein